MRKLPAYPARRLKPKQQFKIPAGRPAAESSLRKLSPNIKTKAQTLIQWREPGRLAQESNLIKKIVPQQED